MFDQLTIDELKKLCSKLGGYDNVKSVLGGILGVNLVNINNQIVYNNLTFCVPKDPFSFFKKDIKNNSINPVFATSTDAYLGKWEYRLFNFPSRQYIFHTSIIQDFDREWQPANSQHIIGLVRDSPRVLDKYAIVAPGDPCELAVAGKREHKRTHCPVIYKGSGRFDSAINIADMCPSDTYPVGGPWYGEGVELAYLGVRRVSESL